ncbi:MAG: dehypoxanthine futalosine cyclase [Bacteroidales bacterium]|nr:dehypoxanthine futalosine cyclase [Bacteroidales bacterium]
MRSLNQITETALAGQFPDISEGVQLFTEAPLQNLMALGNILRQKQHPDNKVTWIIDRNVNITNICLSGCKFCNFYRTAHQEDAYITTLHEYFRKIDEMQQLGGNQLLLQGGMHPRLGLDFYQQLFHDLKQHFPTLRLHALGPPEVVHLANMESLSFKEVLQQLVNAGLDSLPGAGAEILTERVRRFLSPVKCSAQEWLDVMRAAHELDLTTSATMMFGHIETVEERVQHLIALRTLQSEKPAGHKGFLNFIPWPFQDENTLLKEKYGVTNKVTPEEYIRMIALSRIMLPNIPHIQASWLTVGKETAQLSLHAGANDFGSIMIEENVVSVAGATNTFDAPGIRQAIRDAGFIPVQRDQDFRYIP